MATKKPLVLYGTQTSQIQPGDTLDPLYTAQQQNLTNGDATSAVIGSAVYISGSDAFIKARANASGTSRVVGLVAATSIAAAALGLVQLGGPLAATTAQWDAVTGQTGGLTAGAFYFLDASTAGKITSTAPSTAGQYVAPIGQAQDATTMLIQVGPTILL